VQREGAAGRIVEHWWPEIGDQHDDDVFQDFEFEESQREIVERLRWRVGKMLEWVVTRGSEISGPSNVAGKPAEIVSRENESCCLGEGWGIGLK
jgi:hypothetical protein